MPAIIIPRRSLILPNYPARINWNNPVTKGLVSALDARGWDYVTRAVGSLQVDSVSTPDYSKYGRAVNFNNNQLNFPTVSGLSYSTNCSVLLIGAPYSSTWGDATENNGLGIRHWFGNKNVISQNAYTYVDLSAWTTVQQVAFTIGASEQFSINVYVDAKTVSQTSQGGASNGYGSSLGSYYGGDSSVAWNAPLHLSLRWDRELSAAEVQALNENIGQLFARPMRRVFVSIPSGGGAAALAGDAIDSGSANGALSTAIPVSAAAASMATSSGAFSTAISFASIAASAAVDNGALATLIQFDGEALAQAAAAGTFTGAGSSLAGGSTGQSSADGALTTGMPLSGGGSANASDAGDITVSIRMSGAALAQALAQGDLGSVPAGMAGNASATATGIVNLLTEIPFQGAASALSRDAGGMTTGLPLSGVSAALSHASGDLTLQVTFSSSALATASDNGHLSTLVQFNASALAQAIAHGTLDTSGDMTYGARTLPVVRDARDMTAVRDARDMTVAI